MIKKLEKIIGDKIAREKLEDFDYNSPKHSIIKDRENLAIKAINPNHDPGRLIVENLDNTNQGHPPSPIRQAQGSGESVNR